MAVSLQVPASEYEARANKLLEHIRSERLSGVVLFDNFHILYLTGFAFIPTERPIALAMNSMGGRVLFVPRLEVEHARAEAHFVTVESYDEYPGNPHPMEQLIGILQRIGMTTAPLMAADSDGYPWILGYRGPSLSELTCPRQVSGEPINAKPANVNPFLEHMMSIKSEAELALIRESIKWGNLAHRLLQKYTRVGANETEVSQLASSEATQAMIDTLGSLYRSQSMWSDGAEAGYRGQIGRNAAIPHSLTTNASFQPGDVLVTGANAPMWGYNSEVERTMIVGDPSSEQARFFNHMKAAQEVAFAALKPRARCADVDKAVRAYYEQNYLMPYWRHHSGHSIGLRYHEGPFLDSGDDTLLEPGMVFTVEPGLYVPDLGGFRHSDTVLITPGGMERLTYYPRDLQSLTIPL